MGNGKEKLDLAQEMSQKAINKIASALNPVGEKELPFVAFALHTMLDNMLKHMDESQTRVFESMKELFGSECYTQRYDRQEVGGEDSDSNAFTSDRIREKNKRKDKKAGA